MATCKCNELKFYANHADGRYRKGKSYPGTIRRTDESLARFGTLSERQNIDLKRKFNKFFSHAQF